MVMDLTTDYLPEWEGDKTTFANRACADTKSTAAEWMPDYNFATIEGVFKMLNYEEDDAV